MLAASGISDEVIEDRGYRSVSWSPDNPEGRRELRSHGISRSALPAEGSGMVFPVWDVHGKQVAIHFRPDYVVPDPKHPGRGRKYIAPYGRPSVLDVPPSYRPDLKDPSEPLWLTEGGKKADALATLGLCAVSVAGVWNWRSADFVLAEFDEIALRGRTIYLALTRTQPATTACSARWAGCTRCWPAGRPSRGVPSRPPMVRPRSGSMTTWPRGHDR